MSAAAMRAVDAALPEALHGRRGYRRLLQGVPLRISVSGVRGKSGLVRMTHDALRARGCSVYAKVTGTDPQSVKDGAIHPIRRDEARFDMVRETVREVKAHWPMDAIVLENQAIHQDTMRAFNELLARPHYLFVTNIRHDHMGDLARRLEVMALQFGRSAPAGTVVVCGESKADLRRLVEKGARQSGAEFLDAAPSPGGPPGSGSVNILDAMLRHRFGEGLREEERRRLVDGFDQRFRWQPSSLPGIRWFHGAEINDIDSTRAVRDRLQGNERLAITYVAYFRRDRLDRTSSFVPFLEEALRAPEARGAIVCGHRAHAVARRLRSRGAHVEEMPDQTETLPAVIDRLRFMAAGGAVLTIANAVPPWPKGLAQALAAPARDADDDVVSTPPAQEPAGATPAQIDVRAPPRAATPAVRPIFLRTRSSGPEEEVIPR